MILVTKDSNYKDKSKNVLVLLKTGGNISLYLEAKTKIFLIMKAISEVFTILTYRSDMVFTPIRKSWRRHFTNFRS